MNVLVTGGAGYIGSHTAKLLDRSVGEIVVLDDFSMGHRRAARWGHVVEGSLADTDLMRRLMQEQRIDAVVHFAAKAYVGESVEHPQAYFRNNVANTLNLLDAMLETGVTRIVFSSTCATYGLADHSPISETHPQKPVNPYGESKLFVERVLRWYEQAYGLKWMTLRYFNAAGADPDGDIGEDHDPEPHLIPRTIRAALGQLPHIEIFGTDYPTPDGTAVRDYIHVTDLARAHAMALDHLMNGGTPMALNLGTGQGHSVLQVVQAVERAGGRKVPVRAMERRPGDPPVLIADATRAGRDLGWMPQISDLDSIVSSSWRWHFSHVMRVPAT